MKSKATAADLFFCCGQKLKQWLNNYGNKSLMDWLFQFFFMGSIFLWHQLLCHSLVRLALLAPIEGQQCTKCTRVRRNRRWWQQYRWAHKIHFHKARENYVNDTVLKVLW